MTFEEVLSKLEPTIYKDEARISNQILNEVAKQFYIELAQLKSKRRDAHIALARQVAMYLLRQETNYTLREIGNLLGGRTPATVTWGYQRITGSKSRRLLKKLDEIKQSVMSLEIPPPKAEQMGR